MERHPSSKPSRPSSRRAKTLPSKTPAARPSLQPDCRVAALQPNSPVLEAQALLVRPTLRANNYLVRDVMVGVLFGEKIGDKFGRFVPEPAGDALIAIFNPNSKKSLGKVLKSQSVLNKRKGGIKGFFGRVEPAGSPLRRRLLR